MRKEPLHEYLTNYAATLSGGTYRAHRDLMRTAAKRLIELEKEVADLKEAAALKPPPLPPTPPKPRQPKLAKPARPAKSARLPKSPPPPKSPKPLRVPPQPKPPPAPAPAPASPAPLGYTIRRIKFR